MNNVFRPDSYSTPSYLFSRKALQNTYVQYKNTYCRCKICYAMKANGEAEVLQALSSVADGLEVANYDEFLLALDNGFSIDKIICSAPVKILNDLIKMYQGGCRYFVFDCMSEYNRLLRYASESVKIFRIDITDLDHKSIAFGLPYDMAYDYDIQGVAVHLPSRNIELVSQVFKRICCILEQYVKKNIGNSSFYINLGGGYSLNDSSDEIRCINERISEIDNSHSSLNIKWIMEPGNGIVQSAGYFLCRVECVKDKGSAKYVYIDGGIPEGMQVRHGKITNVTRAENSKYRSIYAFFDTTCLHQRLFVYPSKSVYREGDILIISDCGGYTTCYINKFHAKKTPNIIMLDEIII